MTSVLNFAQKNLKGVILLVSFSCILTMGNNFITVTREVKNIDEAYQQQKRLALYWESQAKVSVQP